MSLHSKKHPPFTLSTATVESRARNKNNDKGMPSTKSKNMKCDVPPGERVGTTAAGDRAVNNVNAIAGNKEDGLVPHVVRVTFLGVAGLLAKSSNLDRKSDMQESSSRQVTHAAPGKSIPSAPGHPSLLFHSPSNLRVVASVSRSQAARGIPSGMSKCLFSINNNHKQPPAIERLCTTDDQSIGLDVFDQDPKRNSTSIMENDMKSRIKIKTGSTCLDPAPPSQLSNVRSINKGRNAGFGFTAQENTNNLSSKNIRLPPNVAKSSDASKNTETESVTSEDQSERLVAVWEKALKNLVATTSATHKFVNMTNSLAFEAELRPSSLIPTASKKIFQPTPSTAYAPKSFCITIGLAPDYVALEGAKVSERNKSPKISKNSSLTPPFAIPIGFANLVINGDETLDGKQKQVDLPLSSISDFLGMLDADVLEKGVFPLIELTTDGLEGKKHAEDTVPIVDSVGKQKKTNIVKRIFARKQQPSTEESSVSQIPTVYSGTPRSIFELDRPPNVKERALFLDRYSVDRDAIVRVGLEVFPRGSELEMVFRQKKKTKKSIQDASEVVAGNGSAPVATEDRGRLKKTVLSSTTGVGTNKFGQSSTASVASRALSTADTIGLSLVDEDDDDNEAMLDSDSDATSLSKSFFTLDSDSTWDDSTTYTDALSSFNTVGGDSTSSAISVEESTVEKKINSKQIDSPGHFLSRFMNCHVPTNCGVDNDIDTDISRVTPVTSFSNIDAVTSAVASMSVSDDSRASAWVDHESQANSILSKSSRPVHSDASVDTTKQRTNVISANPLQERREDNVSTTSARSSADRPPLSNEATVPVGGQMVTIQDEVSSLALIIQRIPNNDVSGCYEVEGEIDKTQQNQVDEGHEFTLEDHRSASGNAAERSC